MGFYLMLWNRSVRLREKLHLHDGYVISAYECDAYYAE
jgi:hypothetical protein